MSNTIFETGPRKQNLVVKGNRVHHGARSYTVSFASQISMTQLRNDLGHWFDEGELREIRTWLHSLKNQENA